MGIYSMPEVPQSKQSESNNNWQPNEASFETLANQWEQEKEQNNEDQISHYQYMLAAQNAMNSIMQMSADVQDPQIIPMHQTDNYTLELGMETIPMEYFEPLVRDQQQGTIINEYQIIEPHDEFDIYGLQGNNLNLQVTHFIIIY